MDYPIYKITIDPKKDSKAEVSAIALVDVPAIEKNFIAFSKQRPQYFIASEEQRIISGPLMIPDKPIYRENEDFGPHYIVFDAPTIKQIAIKYAKKKYQDQINAMHQSGNNLADVTLFESFLSDSSRGIMPMKGYEELSDGTWFGSMYVEDDNTWQAVKDGTFKGFSVEGVFIYQVPQPTANELVDEFSRLFSKIKSSLL